MAYVEIDIFENDHDAQIKKESLVLAGRQNVRIVKCDSLILYECLGTPAKPCIRKYDKDGSPHIYLVISDG